MVDTNCDPKDVDFAIPSNDDASKSIDIILNYVSSAIKDGLEERKKEKDEADLIKEKEESSKNNPVSEVKEDSKEDSKEEVKGDSNEKKKRVRKKITKKSEE